ncbi:hypothetical protein HNP29_004355 [Pseudomonas alcaligenes]|nr:hypothetical protein [Pseudomonas alcaligenes]
MKVERSVQKALLERLNEAKPNAVSPSELKDLIDDMKQLTACCLYLHEHGLVRATISKFMSGESELLAAEITADGVDLLRKYGGQATILEVNTITFHEDEIRHLIEARVLEAKLSDTDKQDLLQTLHQAPADSIRHLTMQLLDAGLENLPRAIQLVRTCIWNSRA